MSNRQSLFKTRRKEPGGKALRLITPLGVTLRSNGRRPESRSRDWGANALAMVSMVLLTGCGVKDAVGALVVLVVLWAIGRGDHRVEDAERAERDRMQAWVNCQREEEEGPWK